MLKSSRSNGKKSFAATMEKYSNNLFDQLKVEETAPDAAQGLGQSSLSTTSTTLDFRKSEIQNDHRSLVMANSMPSSRLDALTREVDQLKKTNETLSVRLLSASKEKNKNPLFLDQDEESTVRSDYASLCKEVEHYRTISQELSAHNEELVKEHNRKIIRRKGTCVSKKEWSAANATLREEIDQLLELNGNLSKKNEKLQEALHLSQSDSQPCFFTKTNDDPDHKLLCTEIAELRFTNREIFAENEELTSDIQDLIEENEELARELQETTFRNASLAYETNTIAVERDEMAERLWTYREGIQESTELEERAERVRRDERIKTTTLHADKHFLEEKLLIVQSERDGLQDRLKELEDKRSKPGQDRKRSVKTPSEETGSLETKDNRDTLQMEDPGTGRRRGRRTRSTVPIAKETESLRVDTNDTQAATQKPIVFTKPRVQSCQGKKEAQDKCDIIHDVAKEDTDSTSKYAVECKYTEEVIDRKENSRRQVHQAKPPLTPCRRHRFAQQSVQNVMTAFTALDERLHASSRSFSGAPQHAQAVDKKNHSESKPFPGVLRGKWKGDEKKKGDSCRTIATMLFFTDEGDNIETGNMHSKRDGASRAVKRSDEQKESKGQIQNYPSLEDLINTTKRNVSVSSSA
jgi:DNA repair exonuclease SbcCD ATPase subunit